MVFKDLPESFPGRHRTSIDAIRSGFCICSSRSALREELLKSSDPQNRIRRGLDIFAAFA